MDQMAGRGSVGRAWFSRQDGQNGSLVRATDSGERIASHRLDGEWPDQEAETNRADSTDDQWLSVVTAP